MKDHNEAGIMNNSRQEKDISKQEAEVGVIKTLHNNFKASAKGINQPA